MNKLIYILFIVPFWMFGQTDIDPTLDLDMDLVPNTIDKVNVVQDGIGNSLDIGFGNENSNSDLIQLGDHNMINYNNKNNIDLNLVQYGINNKIENQSSSSQSKLTIEQIGNGNNFLNQSTQLNDNSHFQQKGNNNLIINKNSKLNNLKLTQSGQNMKILIK